MRFKQALISATFSLLLAGNALAVNTSQFTGLSDWQAQHDAAVQQSGAAPIAMSSATDDDYSVAIAQWLDHVSVTPVAESRDWLLIPAALGLVGVMVERTKRRMG